MGMQLYTSEELYSTPGKSEVGMEIVGDDREGSPGRPEG